MINKRVRQTADLFSHIKPPNNITIKFDRNFREETALSHNPEKSGHGCQSYQNWRMVLKQEFLMELMLEHLAVSPEYAGFAGHCFFNSRRSTR
jgi:hypothetical protein